MARPARMIRERDSTTTEVATVVWGAEVERGDFLKVPRALLRMGGYSSLMGKEIQPRHVLLLLNLASRKFRDAPLIVEWKHIARDLGVSADTVRHWAYELRDHKLLSIKGRYLSETESRRRTKGVEIDFSAFVELVSRSAHLRRRERQQHFIERLSTDLEKSKTKIPF